MHRFSKTVFLAATDDIRLKLCDELASLLLVQLKSQQEFHSAVGDIVAELRAAGHDLWSFDASDEMEAWCPNYVEPSEPGLVLTFFVDRVHVEWSKTQ